MKKLIFILIVLVLFTLGLAATDTALAASKSHSKTGLIALYNPNGGGILASISLTVHSGIYNRTVSSSNYSKYVGMSVHASTHKNSFVQCGGSMDVVSPSRVGNTNFILVNDQGPHWGDANYVYDYKKTGYDRILNHGTYTVTSKAQFYPNPSSCMGGGSVTDSFSFNNG